MANKEQSKQVIDDIFDTAKVLKEKYEESFDGQSPDTIKLIDQAIVIHKISESKPLPSITEGANLFSNTFNEDELRKISNRFYSESDFENEHLDKPGCNEDNRFNSIQDFDQPT